jgi:hypothetical protein
LPIGLGNAGSVAYQTACRGELAQAMDRGNPLSDRQRREPIDVAGEERIE